jgi:DNA-binding CsgD family transcriptional regulator
MRVLPATGQYEPPSAADDRVWWRHALGERHALAAEAAGVGAWDYDAAADRLYWSDLARELLGVEPGIPESLALWIERVHPDDRDALSQALSGALDPRGTGLLAVTFRVAGASGRAGRLVARGRATFPDTRPGRGASFLRGVVMDANGAALRGGEAADERSDWKPLTVRERDVAAAVARGMTNRQIATAVVIEEGTVANHVRRILRRLGFQCRAQLAAWVAEDVRRRAYDPR